MKKAISAILSLVILATPLFTICFSAEADQQLYKGELGEETYFTMDFETGEFTLYCASDANKSISSDEIFSKLNDSNKTIDCVKSIVVTEGINFLDIGMFNGFKNARAVTLPKSLKRICIGAFSNCESLKTVNYGGTKQQWSSVVIDRDNDVLKNASFNYSCNVLSNGYGSEYSNDGIIEFNAGRTERDSVKGVFNYYTGVLTLSGKGEIYVNGNSGIHADEYISFFSPEISSGVNYVNKVIIGEGITKISSEFFEYYINLSKVSIPKSLKSIGGYSFYRCDRLQNVYYAGNYADWKDIKIAEDNDELLKAKVHFASKVSAKGLTYTLSETGRAYDGKSHTPTVTVKDKYGRRLKKGTDYTVTMDGGRKAVGKYKVFIKLKGEYTGQKTMYFTIKPKGTSISKINARKKGFTVIWKTQKTQTDGYQVQYSTSSNFTKPKTITLKKNTNYAKKITNLKGKKKYYVRVRTYKTVTFKGESLKIYSGWSKAKAVTTK